MSQNVHRCLLLTDKREFKNIVKCDCRITFAVLKISPPTRISNKEKKKKKLNISPMVN